MALLGLPCGILAALPMAVLLVRGATGMGRGMAAVAFSFALVQGAMFAVRVLAPAELSGFGVLAVLALLATTVVGALRAPRG